MKLFFRIVFIMFFVLPIISTFAEIEDDNSFFNKTETSDLVQKNLDKIKTQQFNKQLKLLRSLQGSKDEASILALTSQILNYDPDNAYTLNFLGVFYLTQGKNNLAKIILTRALQKHSKNSAINSNLAIIALKEEKKEEAIKIFRKSLNYKYSNYSAAAYLGTFYIQAYEYDNALEYLSLSYNRVKNNLLSYDKVLKIGNNYAVALAWSGRFRKSKSVFQELILEKSIAIEVFLNYAILLSRDLKEKKKAYYYLKKANFHNKSRSYKNRQRVINRINAIKKYIKKM